MSANSRFSLNLCVETGKSPIYACTLWGGYLWSEGCAVRTAGVVTGAKIEEYINRA